MRKTAGIDVTHVSIKWDRAKTDVSPYLYYATFPTRLPRSSAGVYLCRDRRAVFCGNQNVYRKFEKMWHSGPDRYL